jgi:hypothetical protein
MATIITSSPGSAITPAVAGKYAKPVSNYNVSADNTTFIKEQDIAVYATGLRPSTRMYVFFDEIRVSEFTTPATTDFTKSNLALTDFHAAGSRGAATYTDANGRFAAIIHIPQASFFTGDRQVSIVDVDDLNSISASTTKASYTFHSFNNHTPIRAPSPPTAVAPIGSTVVESWYGNSPLAQSIHVGSDGLGEADGVFVTSLDLYFESKDAVQGVTIDIRQIQNGVPSKSIIPYSTITIPASSVNVSNDASTATTVAFKAPIFLPSDNFYAITVSPDGNNPNYRVYTSTVGGSDLQTENPVFKNWGQGDLFTSTNGDTWNPIPNEFLKFTLNRAEFTSTANSSVSLVNKDYEFFYISNAYGHFEQGEYAFQLASNVVFTNASSSSNTVSINANTYTVTLQGLTGTVTSGFTQFSNTTVLIASNGSYYDTLFVDSVTNTSSMTIKNVPTFSGNVTVQWTPAGKVYNYDLNYLDLTLVDSTASNNAFKFTQNSTIVGVTSRANTQIGIIRDRVINRFAPFFHNMTLQNATIDLQLLNTITGTYGNTAVKSYSTSSMNNILNDEVVIASKSNEIANMNGRKSFSANLVLNATSGFVSPVVDVPTSSVLAYRNMITNQYYGENTKNGLAINKYISKTITLASGLDSEDLVVYIDAYRPKGTTINVYGKFLSAADPETFDSKDWTLLLNDQYSSTLYSDSTNLSDVKELKFSVPTSPFSTIKTGAITTNTANATVGGLNTTFTSDVKIGDLVKIYSDSTKATFQVSKVTAIANNTSMTIDNNSSFNTTAGSYERVDFPHTAFINEQNGNILRYYSAAGVPYDTFITYAIKIVLASETTYVVPRILNLRAIAVT